MGFRSKSNPKTTLMMPAKIRNHSPPISLRSRIAAAIWLMPPIRATASIFAPQRGGKKAPRSKSNFTVCVLE
jgi:hypothetical protein